MQDERSSRTQRRVLVLGMCLSYFGCLATLWYTWNAPRQWFDTIWLRFGANRFTLIVIPLIVFCVCYFKLSCICGDMLKLRGKQLDERQRMVRDSAHRTAYRIVTFLCLFIPVYLAIQGLIANTQATPTAVNSLTITAHPVVKAWVTIVQSDVHSTITHSMLQWYMALASASHSETTTAIAAPPHTSLDSGIYYSLVLLTLLLIISTLPKAIIAWKER